MSGPSSSVAVFACLFSKIVAFFPISLLDLYNSILPMCGNDYPPMGSNYYSKETFGLNTELSADFTM
jgi:hypothetical protein